MVICSWILVVEANLLDTFPWVGFNMRRELRYYYILHFYIIFIFTAYTYIHILLSFTFLFFLCSLIHPKSIYINIYINIVALLVFFQAYNIQYQIYIYMYRYFSALVGFVGRHSQPTCHHPIFFWTHPACDGISLTVLERTLTYCLKKGKFAYCPYHFLDVCIHNIYVHSCRPDKWSSWIFICIFGRGGSGRAKK